MKSFFLFFLFILGKTITGYSQNPDETAISNLNRAWLDALVREDSMALSNILADDFVLINPGGIRRTKRDTHVHVPGQKITAIEIDSQDLRLLSSDIGIITVWTTNHIQNGTEKMVLKICYMDIYRKRNKRWQAVAGHVTLLGNGH